MSKLKIALGALVVVASSLSLPAEGAAHDTGAKAQAVIASWYGPKFHGKRTANGERFDMTKLTAAHRTLPFGTKVRVTNPANDKSVVVRINDRGPFSGKRGLDLSREAAKAIGLMKAGVGKVRMEVLGRGSV